MIQVYEHDFVPFGPEYLIVFCFAAGLSIGVAFAVSILLYYQVSLFYFYF